MSLVTFPPPRVTTGTCRRRSYDFEVVTYQSPHPSSSLRHVPLSPMYYIKELTAMKKAVQLYASDDVIEEFYRVLASGDSKAMRTVHIPKSDVFYVREALYHRMGEWYSLDHVERAMYLEGMLDRKDVLDPDRERDGIG